MLRIRQTVLLKHLSDIREKQGDNVPTLKLDFVNELITLITDEGVCCDTPMPNKDQLQSFITFIEILLKEEGDCIVIEGSELTKLRNKFNQITVNI